jgi:hypothetical protein
VRRQLGRDEPASALAGESAEQRRLPTRPGAEVQPAPVTPLDRRGGQGQRHQLAALVLDARAALPDRRDRAWLAARQRRRKRRPPSRQRPCLDQLGDLGAARAGHQADRRSHVVGRQQRRGLVERALQRVADGGHHPARVRVRHREVPHRVHVVRRGELAHPVPEVAGADPAEDRVDELGAPVAEGGASQLDGGGHRRV